MFAAGCQRCSIFPTNIVVPTYTGLAVVSIATSYGRNADDCSTATLRCTNSEATDILIEVRRYLIILKLIKLQSERLANCRLQRLKYKIVPHIMPNSGDSLNKVLVLGSRRWFQI